MPNHLLYPINGNEFFSIFILCMQFLLSMYCTQASIHPHSLRVGPPQTAAIPADRHGSALPAPVLRLNQCEPSFAV